MATHSRIPAWRIPWTDEPGGLQSTGSRKEWNTAEQLNNNKLNNMAKNITRQTGIWILKVLFHRRTKQGVLNKLVRAC